MHRVLEKVHVHADDRSESGRITDLVPLVVLSRDPEHALVVCLVGKTGSCLN